MASFWDSLKYFGKKVKNGFLRAVEGGVDYVVGGVADLFGYDEYAEELMGNDWINYGWADEEYRRAGGNTESGFWATAGSIGEGIGSSLPYLAIGIATSGLGTVASGFAAAGTAITTAGGTATSEAYKETGELGAKQWGYGTLSGTKEAALELATGGFGKGIAAAGRSLGKTLAKESTESAVKSLGKATAKSIGRNSFIKSVAGDMISEGFEEGLSEYIDPYLKRVTYDPNAKDATIQEIGYAALVGSLSGATMSSATYGIGKGVSTVSDIKSGKKAVSSNTVDEIVNTARSIAAFEETNHTGFESSEDIVNTLKKLDASLEKTGGKVSTTEQEKLIGRLKRDTVETVGSQLMFSSVENILNNADAFVQQYNAAGIRGADGQVQQITREQLLDGIDFANTKNTNRSIAKALKNNDTLRNLAAQDAAGRLMLDAAAYKNAVLSGQAQASEAWLADFSERASDAEYADFAEKLGLDLSKATAKDVRKAAQRYMSDPVNAAVIDQVREAKKISTDKAKALPKNVGFEKDGVKRYTLDGKDLAVMKKDGTYRVYEYDTGDVSPALGSKSELNKFLRNVRGAISAQNAQETANTDVNEQAQAAEPSAALMSLQSGTNLENAGVSKGESPASNTGKNKAAQTAADEVVDLTDDSDLAKEVEGLRGSGKYKKIQQYILRVLGKQPLTMSDGKQVIVDNSDASHIASKAGDSKISRIAKIKELVENAKLDSEDKNPIHDKFNYFCYYVAKVKYKNETFPIYLNVGKTINDGKYHLYDITKNKRDTANRLNGFERPKPNEGYALGNDVSKNSIPDLAGKVNRISEKSSENSSRTEQKTERAKQAEAADKILRENVKDYTQISAPAQTMVRKTYRDAKSSGMSDAEAITYAAVSARSGASIQFSNQSTDLLIGYDKNGNAKYADGVYLPSENKIVVNPEGTRTAERTLIHELMHAIYSSYRGNKKNMSSKIFAMAKKNMPENERTKIENDYKGLIEQRQEHARKNAEFRGELLALKSPSKADKIKSKLKKGGEKVAKAISDDIITDETTAYYAEKALTNKKMLESLVAERPSLIDTILSFFKGAAESYSDNADLSRAARRFEKQYRKMFDEFASRNKGRNATESISRVNPVQGEKRSAIVALDDGKLYVEAERNVINGTTRAEQRKEITDFFTKLLQNKPSIDIHTIEGDVLTITKAQTADKARDDFKTEHGKVVRMTDEEFVVKLRVESHIDEIAEISQSDKSKKVDTKKHSFAKDGFTYRTAYFKDFDGKYYNVTLSIGNNGTVATVYNVGKTKESVSPSAKIIAVVGSMPLGETPSDIIISNLTAKVNTLDEKYLKSVEKGDMETAQRMVEEAAKAKMPKSKITMPDGSLRKVYHGTNTGDFTVFNPDYIGMSSGDDGFFGKGFYFAYSEGEAKYYGGKRIVSAYLNIEKPFDFQTEMQMFNGKRAVSGRAPDAVAFLNFAEKFPDLAKDTFVTVFDGEEGKDISLIEFAKAFKDVLENKKFEYQTVKNEFGEKETVALADKKEYTYEYDGEKKTYYDYDFQKRFYGEANEIDVAYEYLSTVVYKHIDMYSRTRLILDKNDEFTQSLKDKGYDGTIQSAEGDEAVAFYSEQIKSADTVTYDNDGKVIPLSERFNPENDDIRFALPLGTKITANMTEEERAYILRNQSVVLKEIQIPGDTDLNWDELERNRKSKVEKPLIKKLRDLGFLRAYKTDTIDVEFEFTAGGLKKSLHSQVSDYGGNISDLTKVVMNMQGLLDSAVLLEIHKDKAKGTPRENSRLLQTYVLLSAFQENGQITPVQFEVKQYIDNQNRLYLAVALTKIETSVMDDTVLQKGERTRLLPVSDISIPQLIKKINPKDENFFKYIPDKFLTKEQLRSKERALEREAKKYGYIPSDASFALPLDEESPTLENVGKTSFKKENFGSLKDKFYIEAVDETYGIEKYLRKIGKREDAIPFVQQVRAAETMAQSMLGTDQYDITEGATQSGKRLGDGLAKIFEPITKRAKADKKYAQRFDDYLLHHLNVDRMTLDERTFAEQKARIERVDVLNKRTIEINYELKDLKGKRDKASTARRRTLKAELKEINAEQKNLEKEIKAYVPVYNKPVFDENDTREKAITADESRKIIEEYDKKFPQFREIAEKVWKYADNLLEMRVEAGLISAENAALMRKYYPHYVPSFRDVENSGKAVPVKGAGNIEVSSTVKRAKGGGEDIFSIRENLAKQTVQAVKAIQINRLANAVYDAAVEQGDTQYVEVTERKKVDGEQREDRDTDVQILTKTNQVTFYKDGEKITMSVSKDLFLGFKGLTSPSTPDFIIAKVLNTGMRWFKNLVTQFSPAFAVRNAIKDLQDAYINSKHPIGFFKNSMKGAFLDIINNSEQWQLYRAYGGFASTVFDAKGFSSDVGSRGFEALKSLGIESDSNLKKILGGGKNVLKDVLIGIGNVNAFIEQLTRYTEFKASLAAGSDVQTAINNSAEVTTNFSRRGSLTKVLNSVAIPFLNASIQGTDKAIRVLKDAFGERNAKMVARAITVLFLKIAAIGIAPMLINNLINAGDEDYENLEEEVRENYFLIKIGDEFLKIPRGRVASVWGGLANRISLAAQGKDADISGYLENVWTQMSPVESASRTILAPFNDIATNTTWYGGDIEGREFDGVRPKDRYDESTSSIAIEIGQVTGWSPKKIHYLLDQYSGVIGDFVLPATTKKAEKNYLEANFLIDPVTNNKLSADFYKLYDEAQYKKNEGDTTAIYQLKHLNDVKAKVSDLYDDISKVQNSDKTSAEKLQETRTIRVLINNIYKTAKTDYAAYTKAIESTEGLFDESTDTGVRMRHTEITRRMYGAEAAFKEWNTQTYDKMKLLNSSGIDYQNLYIYYFGTKDIENDVDKKGNVIAGSKKKKIEKAINTLDISKKQKALLLAASGYSVGDYKPNLLKYILSLNISQAEKLELAKAAGFTVKNGKIDKKSVFGTGSTGDSKKTYSLNAFKKVSIYGS